MKVKYATGMPALEIGRGTLQLSKRMDHQPYTNLTSFYINLQELSATKLQAARRSAQWEADHAVDNSEQADLRWDLKKRENTEYVRLTIPDIFTTWPKVT